MTIEPDRYELHEGPAYRFELNRREWLEALGGGLLVLVLASNAEAQESGGGRGGFRGTAMPQDVGAWLHIGPDGAVKVFTGKVEVGQNIRTSLAQAVAEELRTPLDSVRMVMGDTALCPFDMGTFGSLTTPMMSPQLRRAGAAAREALIDLAAQQWNSDRASLSVRDGRVLNGSKSASFGELTHGQKLVQTIPANPQLTPSTGWKIMDQPVKKVNAQEIVTGAHKYPSDMTAPGMLFGKVVRPAAFGATLESADTKAAEAMSGVVVVRDGDFLAVAAPDPRTAEKAAAVIQANWKAEPQPSSRDLFEYLKANPAGEPQRAHEAGSIEPGLSSAEIKLKQTYQVAYIAHTPLEPRAALAEWSDDGRLTVWTGTQRPFGVRSELAQAFRVPEERVHVMMPDMGSGYGGKHSGECAVEAARIAKTAKKPVKLVWTREEEFTWAYFRPAGVIEIASGARRDGTVIAWDFHNYNSGSAGIRGTYNIANQRIEFHPTKSPLRQGSYRALASTANHFARESHMDELAHAAGIEPLRFRLHNLTDERQKAVLQAAADKFGWAGFQSGAGRGCGIACGFDKNGYVATCVDLSVDRARGAVKLNRVVTAWDSGAVVNPDGLRNQIEGSNIMGIGGALFETIQFDNGRILNPRLSKYRVPRFSDVPAIETVLVGSKDVTPAGAGEIPIVGLAPAVGNAIFAATGVRLRSLPLVPSGLRQGDGTGTG
jgi:CO/xanthine dehydrogenase Mo-binding subunit